MAVKIPFVIVWISKEQMDCTFWVEIPDGGGIDFLWYIGNVLKF